MLARRGGPCPLSDFARACRWPPWGFLATSLALRGDAAMVVASPKARARAALIAAGDASFERLRLLERVLRGDADLFALVAAGADAFRFLAWAYVGRGGPTGGRFGRRAMLLSPRIAPRSAS